jgi:hypothetical protein
MRRTTTTTTTDRRMRARPSRQASPSAARLCITHGISDVLVAPASAGSRPVQLRPGNSLCLQPRHTTYMGDGRMGFKCQAMHPAELDHRAYYTFVEWLACSSPHRQALCCEFG